MLPPRSQDWIVLLQRLADCADGITLRHFRSPSLAISHKPDGSPVTEADLEVERAVEALARQLAPELSVLGEEYGDRPGPGAARLIIDPIDATLNFIRGSPVFATLLAVQIDAEVVAGLVSAPALPGRWWAARRWGAWRDGHPIHVSGCNDLVAARLLHGTPSDTGAGARYPGFAALLGATRPNRDVGDFLQHLRVAEGLAEVAIDLEVAPWDIAALKIIVEEAGGAATSTEGRGTLHGGTLVSTNGRLHDRVLSFLRRQPPQSASRAPPVLTDTTVASPALDRT